MDAAAVDLAIFLIATFAAAMVAALPASPLASWPRQRGCTS
jgi:hypothetical protein